MFSVLWYEFLALQFVLRTNFYGIGFASLAIGNECYSISNATRPFNEFKSYFLSIYSLFYSYLCYVINCKGIYEINFNGPGEGMDARYDLQ